MLPDAIAQQLLLIAFVDDGLTKRVGRDVIAFNRVFYLKGNDDGQKIVQLWMRSQADGGDATLQHHCRFIDKLRQISRQGECFALRECRSGPQKKAERGQGMEKVEMGAQGNGSRKQCGLGRHCSPVGRDKSWKKLSSTVTSVGGVVNGTTYFLVTGGARCIVPLCVFA